MPIKNYRPTTPTRRFQTVVSRQELTDKKPEKSLTAGKRRTGGRNNLGRTTSRFRGGGHQKSYRIIDFFFNRICIGLIGIKGTFNERVHLLSAVDELCRDRSKKMRSQRGLAAQF